MKRHKIITNLIVTSLFAVLISTTALSGFVRFVLTNKNLYLNLLNSTDTYPLVQDKLYEKMDYLLGSDVDNNLKENIIKEEDVRKEAEVVLDCIISNMKTGQAEIPQIDTEIYKERVAESLKSLIPTLGDSEDKSIISYNSDENLNLSKNVSTAISKDAEAGISNLNYYAEDNNIYSCNLDNTDIYSYETEDVKSESIIDNNDDKVMARLKTYTRAEIEAMAAQMLKDKGLTEAEARQKLAERGFTESDVWNYLAQNGYLKDENTGSGNNNNNNNSGNTGGNSNSNGGSQGSGGNNSNGNDSNTDVENPENNGNNADDNNIGPSGDSNSNDNNIGSNGDSNSNGNNSPGNSGNSDNSGNDTSENNISNLDEDDIKVSKDKIQNIIFPIILNPETSLEEKMEEIYARLMEESEIIINYEIQKLNLSEYINTNIFKIFVKCTSFLYNIFYISLAALIALTSALLINNKSDMKKAISYIGSAATILGIISTIISGYIYYFEAYKIIQNYVDKEYLNNMILSTASNISRLMLIISLGIFVAGIFINLISMNKQKIQGGKQNEVS